MVAEFVFAVISQLHTSSQVMVKNQFEAKDSRVSIILEADWGLSMIDYSSTVGTVKLVVFRCCCV